ncbi:MAG: hypothetical protein GFH27_549279n143 [Chloroflexi bacterium AL-W]|nr:hypothetical protein [Chloroflexi bacterium AL-N1]NOK65109.1 hypothetical protein [Chloroflexi bacterium AL-N10]NOK72624.1 hypothetical protein [Chloroflexi bacterium AL-N5]NOK79288.1 hypothetical protein [Chloroflexi bacterium AL-W]NOK87204.1 hypothetical protein [Chloroflexi bacterium AL-N15]
MRRDVVETIILGVSIGMGVAVVRLLTVNMAYNPWIVLGIAAILLCLLQIFFIVLRRRSGNASKPRSQEMKQPSGSRNGVSASTVQRTSSPDLFARELNHNWTGLETADDQTLSHNSALDNPSSSDVDTPFTSDVDTPPTDEVLEKDSPRSYS